MKCDNLTGVPDYSNKEFKTEKLKSFKNILQAIKKNVLLL